MVDGEMISRPLLTTLLQMFCESMLNTKVIFKVIEGPVDTLCPHQGSTFPGAYALDFVVGT